MVTIEPGATATVDFVLQISPVHEEVTVTASAVAERSFDAFNAVMTLDSFDLVTNIEGTLGAVLEWLEIVRGPATLFYGSNAVVNAITPHETFMMALAEGFRGQIMTDAGSADAAAGANGSFQLGQGRWILWGRRRWPADG